MPNMHRAAWGFMQSGDFPVPVLHLKFGEGSGNALKDSSPEGNDGVNHGASWAKGYLGPGLGFEGVDNYVSVAHADSLDIRNEFTSIIRVKVTEIVNSTSIIDKGWNWRWLESLADDWFASIVQDSVATVFTVNTETGTLSEAVDKWISLGLTYSVTDSLLIAYLGGVEVDRTATNGLPLAGMTGSDLWLGRRGAWYKGMLDELIIFDVKLTAAQMRQDAQGYR